MDHIPSSPEPVNPEARGEVSGPAIFLMGVGILSLLNALYSCISMLSRSKSALVIPPSIANNPEMADYLPLFEQLNKLSSGPVAYAFIVLAVGLAVLMIVGGWSMKNLEHRSLAMTGSIVALVPCFSCCCVVGMPAGIWALLVLNKPHVKAAFRS